MYSFTKEKRKELRPKPCCSCSKALLLNMVQLVCLSACFTPTHQLQEHTISVRVLFYLYNGVHMKLIQSKVALWTDIYTSEKAPSSSCITPWDHKNKFPLVPFPVFCACEHGFVRATGNNAGELKTATTTTNSNPRTHMFNDDSKSLEVYWSKNLE